MSLTQNTISEISIDSLKFIEFSSGENQAPQNNAGINSTSYHPPSGTSGHMPSPRAFAQQKMLRGGPITYDVPGAFALTGFQT